MKATFEFDGLASGVQEAVIPQRSKLFSLPPMGAGTPQLESMISLLVRTSYAHSVGTRQLIGGVFAQAEPEIADLAYAKFFRSLAATINGLGKYAELFVLATEQLTGQKDLRKHTLLPWKGFFPHNGQGLLAKHPQWCPVCLREQPSKGTGSVFPLAWYLEAPRVCAMHQHPLESRCPQCGKTQPFLPRYPDLGVCDHCRSPLVSHPPDVGGAYLNQDDQLVAEAIGDMLVAQTRRDFDPDVERFREFVLGQVRVRAEGNRAAFCRTLGLHDRGLAGWLNKGERPSITHFLTLCRGLGIMPADIFGGTPSSVPRSLLHPAKLKQRSSVQRPGSGRRKELQLHIQGYLETGECLPVSAVATNLGVTARSLRYWFPEQCRQISLRYRKEAKARSEAHRAMQCLRVEKVVSQIRDSGQYPSRRRVNTALRKQGMSLAQPHLFEAYKKALLSGGKNVQG